VPAIGSMTIGATTWKRSWRRCEPSSSRCEGLRRSRRRQKTGHSPPMRRGRWVRTPAQRSGLVQDHRSDTPNGVALDPNHPPRSSLHPCGDTMMVGPGLREAPSHRLELPVGEVGERVTGVRTEKVRQGLCGAGVGDRNRDHHAPGFEGTLQRPEVSDVAAHGELHDADDSSPETLRPARDVELLETLLAIEDPDVVFAGMEVGAELVDRTTPDCRVIEDAKQPMSRATHDVVGLGDRMPTAHLLYREGRGGMPSLASHSWMMRSSR